MRILIVEDEAVAARGLERKLRAILGSKIESLKIERSLIGSECFIQDSPIDVLFLDLDLNGEDGFNLIGEAAAGSFHTIVVSANVDRAIDAFEYGVIDFVAKPVTEERLRKAIDRLVSGPEKMLKYLSVREEERVRLLQITEILYLEADDNHVLIHCRNGEILRHRKTLETLQQLLKVGFVRVHRKFLVSKIELQSVQTNPGGRYRIVLSNGVILPMSRSCYRSLKS
jgi:two-component system response regulator LytT